MVLRKYTNMKMGFAKALLAVTALVIIGILFLIIIIPFIFGNDDSLWNAGENETVRVNYIVQSEGIINLGDVNYKSKSPYSWESIEGFNDQRQRNMAEELLTLYGRVAEKQSSLISKGFEVQELVKFLLGTHVYETGTYSYKDVRPIQINGVSGDEPHELDAFMGKAPTTYIPLTLVKWEEYGRGSTVGGSVMNFENYSWNDFKKRYNIENPSNTNPGAYVSPSSNKVLNEKYYAGYNYKGLRSVAGAINSFQYQPGTWKTSINLEGAGNSGNPHWIGSLDGFYNEPFTGGRASNFKGTGNADIYSLADQALATLNWFEQLYTVLTNPDGVYKLNKADKDVAFAVFKGWYIRGSNGFPSDISSDPKGYLEDIKKIIRQDDLEDRLYSIYKSNKGHGTPDYELITKVYGDYGWTTSKSGNNTYLKKGSISIQGEVAIPIIRGYFEGIAWHKFLNLLAYGGKEQKVGGTGDLGVVRYNYMTSSNGLRNVSQTVRTQAVESDGFKALGYKGPYPIYDQSGDYMKNYYMLNQNGTPESFAKSACTVFAMSSMANGVGDIPPLNRDFDKDKNGFIDPFEWWLGGRAVLGLNTYEISSKPPTGTGTVSIKTLLRSAGYEVKDAYQGPSSLKSKDNQMILDDLKNKIPHHLRVYYTGTKKYTAYVPKADPKNLDYNNFNMHDENNYESTTKQIQIANSQHSILAVEAKEIHGRWYISIVNSTFHHSDSNAHDVNLMWFDAEDLLTSREYNGYAITGAKNDKNWTMNLRGNSTPITNTGATSSYIGIEYDDALNRIANTYYNYNGNDRIDLDRSSSNDPETIKIKGRFETNVVDSSTLRMNIGYFEGKVTALEFSNITNPRSNSIFNLESDEDTTLFDLGFGSRAIVKLVTIEDTGSLMYKSFREDDSAY